MKKLILSTMSALALSLILVSCHGNKNNAEEVGAGVDSVEVVEEVCCDSVSVEEPAVDSAAVVDSLPTE